VRPVVAEQHAGAMLLGASAAIFLVVCPLTADGERVLYWRDLFLVAVAIAGGAWLRRQRRDYETAAIVPPTAMLASNATVIRRQAAWGAPFLLFVLFAAATTPDFFGAGLAYGVLAAALALEARHAASWEAARGNRLYRGRGGWWSKRKTYRTP
jgi:hypothetical protein